MTKKKQQKKILRAAAPRPSLDDVCVNCGGKPVTHAVWRTGGVFTPPPSGIWTFECGTCSASLPALPAPLR